MMRIGKKKRLIKKESIINRYIFPFKFNCLRIDPKKHNCPLEFTVAVRLSSH